MKKFFLFWVMLCLCFALCIPVWAHGGRTDSSGGHYNRSTGDYHYHHGYPAHDHYDMDGDGDRDCPYNFKKTTNASTQNNNSAIEQPSDSTSGIVVAVVLIAIYVMPILAMFFRRTKFDNIGEGIMTIYFNILMFPFWACCYLFTGITFAIKKIAHFLNKKE